MGVQNFYFSKAINYSKYRLDYSSKAIDYILQKTRVNRNSVVADIGAGTGILAKHFIGKVKEVYAVEPDNDMRSIADKMLAQYKEYHSIDGTSDSSRLQDRSVDLITVGQAIHWFKPESTKQEFKRIIKSNGYLAILWYVIDFPELSEAMKSLRNMEIGWNNTIETTNHTKVADEYYFDTEKPEHLQFNEIHNNNWESFIGSAYSVSFAPNPDDEIAKKFEEEHRKVFDKFSENGVVTLPYTTHLLIGKV